jgi:hypothetical protein
MGSRAASSAVNIGISAPVLLILGAVVSRPAHAQLGSPRISAIEQGVLTAFADFKSALLVKDGARAANYVDDGTAALYERIRLSALAAQKVELLKATLHFQVAVLTIRQSFKKADLQTINGRELYGKTVSAGGASGAMGLENLAIMKVYPEKNGLSALADLGLEGRAETFRIQFFNNRGRWQINLRDLITLAADEMEGRLGISRRTPPDVMEGVIEQYLFPAIAEQSGRPVGAEIWVPLVERP